MDTRLAILSAAAFAGVVLGGAVVAEPGLAGSLNPASVWSNLRGGEPDARLVQQGGEAATQNAQLIDAQFTTDGSASGAATGTRGHDEHENGRSKGDARTATGGSSGEREHDDEEDDD
jgi:hypothetical protein